MSDLLAAAPRRPVAPWERRFYVAVLWGVFLIAFGGAFVRDKSMVLDLMVSAIASAFLWCLAATIPLLKPETPVSPNVLNGLAAGAALYAGFAALLHPPPPL